jgi:hypothetical protein
MSAMSPSERSALERISEELELDSEIMGFLDDSGLRPGASLTFLAASPQGEITIDVEGGPRVGINPFMADRLFVVA